MDISPKPPNNQDTIHRPYEVQEGRSKCGCFGPSHKENKILTEANMEIKCGAETDGKATRRLSHLGIHPIYSYQTQTFLCGYQEVHAERRLICLSPEWALEIHRQMFAANHWTECGVPNREVRERTEGVEGICNLIGRTTISTNQTPPELPGTSHQQRSTHSSSCICSRGWPCHASVEGEVLGPVKAQHVPQCRGIGGRKVGVGRWVEEAGGGRIW